MAMNKEQVIRELRGLLHDHGQKITQEQYDAIVAAIRLLGGNP
jgi:hypothetical protein